MALKNYYKLSFNNKSEYIIRREETKTKDVLGILAKNVINSEYVVLQYDKGESLYIRKDQLFSVQKVPNVSVGSQTRIWEIV